VIQRLRAAAHRRIAADMGKSRLKGVPPTVGLRRRSPVHAGGRSANGSIGAISIARLALPQNNAAHPASEQHLCQLVQCHSECGVAAEEILAKEVIYAPT